MAVNLAAVEPNEYRVAMIDPASGAVLTVKNPNGAAHLPRIQIPANTRVTEYLLKAIQTAWKVRAVVLDYLQSEDGYWRCAVLELLPGKAPTALCPMDIHEIADDFSDGERASLLSLLGDASTSFLSHMGWIYEAVAWVEKVTGERIRSIFEVEQLNAGARFALVRLPMRSGRSYWLKATGEPNTHEQPITLYLSELCPSHLPEVLAVDPVWNAWIMPDKRITHGQLPTSPRDRLQLLQCAVTAIAEVQRHTAGREADLLAAGAFDQRLNILRADSELLFENIGEAMALQTSTKVPRIHESRLHELNSVFDATCEFVQTLGIPNTILHGDLHAGNVLCGADGCQFIDWCEAYVGHPLVTLQHLLLLNSPEDAQLKSTWDQELIERYQMVMNEVCERSALEQGVLCMPLIAAASTMYGRGAWIRSPLVSIPHQLARIRTLARHMDRAAQEPALLDMLFRDRAYARSQQEVA